MWFRVRIRSVQCEKASEPTLKVAPASVFRGRGLHTHCSSKEGQTSLSHSVLKTQNHTQKLVPKRSELVPKAQTNPKAILSKMVPKAQNGSKCARALIFGGREGFGKGLRGDWEG